MSKSKLVDTIGNFTTIPNSVIEMGKELEPDALALFVVLRFHSGQNQTAFPSYDTIQQRTGLTRRRIALAIRKLESLKLLERKKRFGASTIYILKMPTSTAGGLMEIEPLVQQIDHISTAGGLSLVQQVDTNKTQLTRLIKKETAPNGAAVRKVTIKELEQLETTFADLRGVDLPDWENNPRAAQKTWRTPLKALAQTCRSVEDAELLIQQTIRKMNGLTYTEPIQILKTAKSLLADRKQGPAPASNDRYEDVY